MSWAAHEFESYVLHKHTGVKASWLAILVGCLLPDLFTKLPVYGLDVGVLHVVHASEPWKYHRGWPGVGPTHSLLFVALVALVVLWMTRSRAWTLGILIGGWAHVITDCFDSTGTMLFFPFTTQHYSLGMWAYASQEGRYGDASAYYSSLGGVWDGAWLLICLLNFRVFRRDHFEAHVAPHDPVWAWLQRRFGLRTNTLVFLYRAYFIYGFSRVVGWFVWARVANPNRGTDVLDLSWGGPRWVVAAPDVQRAATWTGAVIDSIFGLCALSALLAAIWFGVGRRLWRRCPMPRLTPLLEDQSTVPATSTVTATGQ